ncbi:hypothetical protein ARMSODRAFT_1021773 [Armillaria solidipes]|uniref:Uncharacterized protein n=1 Tax=Armillaria solidipes TaxID=1076256 RepID=A0A2H3BGL3_9AGAR|nr:hypothetical protein ARMSODRAFT_1021773 [Armillaria solidipes]
MAQDFCNPYERAPHSSRVLLVLKVPPSVSLRLHIYDIRWCPAVCFFLDLMVFGAQGRLDSIRFEIAEAMSFRMLGSYVSWMRASGIDIIRRYTRRRILNVRDDDLDQWIFLDDLNHSDVCITVIPVRFRISKFP